MKIHFHKSLPGLLFFILISCQPSEKAEEGFYKISREDLSDKIKGAWALQTIGVTFGGPTEFRYQKKMIPDSVPIHWSDTMMYHWMTRAPGLYDDIYMDLTFVDILEREGLDAPASSFGRAYAHAGYMLWHANQQGRYNILNGIMPPESGHWLNNPHADDIDFQIEADFAGIMSPGMPNAAAEVCDRVGHVMNSGDGYYGGVYMAALYSYAFISKDIREVVNKALALIPKESTYYQCIADVVNWHSLYPNDWKETWQKVEEKWGEDIGCPDGAGEDFNIDAKMNSAYVVIGLLYGNGDLDRTMDIATRCGQDSDCNPASAAGVLGAMIGYQGIPPKWAAGLSKIEDLDFQHTTISLNDVYGISLDHALQLTLKNGGKVEEEQVFIRLQEPVPVKVEQNFPGYVLTGKKVVQKQLTIKSPVFEIHFEGVGIVVRGKPGNSNFKNSWALFTEEETLKNFVVELECSLDDLPVQRVKLPLDFIKRNPEEVYFRYELAPGAHQLKIKAQNLDASVFVDIWDVLLYTKNQ